MKKDKFKLLSYLVMIVFALMIIYPLLYITTNAMKDSARIYDVPPQIFPDAANSLSVVVDYSSLDTLNDDELLPLLWQDHIISAVSSVYEMPKDSIFEIKFYGTMHGKTIYYARAHRTRIDLEKDNGVFKGIAITQKTLVGANRCEKAVNSLGYTFDRNGIAKKPTPNLQTGELNTKAEQFLCDKYQLSGKISGTNIKQNNLLLAESFIHYIKLPSFVYSRNEVIAKYSFFSFFFNTALVLCWAVLTQVVLCAITAFPLSRLLPKKTANMMLLFFLGSTMIPFVAVMIPQFTMFKQMGFYDNYAALLLPHLLPYGFFVYLYKGFFDNLPGSLFEAARIDGAGNGYIFFKICMPLSKPIISVIALQTFLANWNDFFWAWMVTEKQNLWTLNVALYNISKVTSVKPNFIMGLSVLTIVPVLLLTILFSNQIKASIATAGIKG
ncbi:MAG: carbohydrate ABC transporter permease [Oscillospiraceae bacterium]